MVFFQAKITDQLLDVELLIVRSISSQGRSLGESCDEMSAAEVYECNSRISGVMLKLFIVCAAFQCMCLSLLLSAFESPHLGLRVHRGAVKIDLLHGVHTGVVTQAWPQIL